MPTENEVRVMKILTAIDIIPADAAKRIQDWGNEAVTVVCEAALGSYPGLRMKVRTNAAALLGWIDHPQANETLELLVDDANPDVAVRAIRAVGRRKLENLVTKLTQILNRSGTSPILVAEVIKALLAIDTSSATAAVTAYESSTTDQHPHRSSRVVQDVLLRRRTK